MLKATLVKTVAVPLTFFWIYKFVPSIYALYQLFPSLQRTTSPKLLLANELIEPVAYTSASEVEEPNTAL